MYFFRIIRGIHSEKGRIYERGEVICTQSDLAGKFNKAGSVKFVPIDPLSHEAVAAKKAAASLRENPEESKPQPVSRRKKSAPQKSI